MRHPSLAAVVLIVATFFAALTVQAQSVSQRVNVPFKFNLADKAYPAATYFIRYDGATDTVEFLGNGKNMLARTKVITKLALAPGARSDGKVRLVFDQVGEERYLSEVWMPGAEGLLLRATSERHKHETVDSSN